MDNISQMLTMLSGASTNQNDMLGKLLNNNGDSQQNPLNSLLSQFGNSGNLEQGSGLNQQMLASMLGNSQEQGGNANPMLSLMMNMMTNKTPTATANTGKENIDNQVSAGSTSTEKKPHTREYGLLPIANIASKDIIFLLNKYFFSQLKYD